MIVLCTGLLDGINTFLQPVIHCLAFGSVLLLGYARACFWLFEKSAAVYAHSSTVVDFTRYMRSACQHICGHWALKLQNIFTEYKTLIKMQQYVYVVVLRYISGYIQTVSLGRTAFLVFFLFLAHSTKRAGVVSMLRCSHSPITTIKQQCKGRILQSQKDVIEVH